MKAETVGKNIEIGQIKKTEIQTITVSVLIFVRPEDNTETQ